MAETQAEKVDRLIESGAVSKQLTLPDGGSVWRINGDTGAYRIQIDDVGVEWSCSCPAGLKGRQDCAHAWAVLKLMGLDPPEVAELPVDMPVQDIDRGSMTVVEPSAATFADRANHDETTDEQLEVDVVDDDQADVLESGADLAVPDTEPRRDLIDIATAPITWRTLEAVSQTEFVPGALRGRPGAVLAAVLLGRDWGLGPLESLRMIDVIDGSPGPSAELLLRLYRRAGHTLDVHQADSQGVVVTGKRGDTGETLKISFTLEDAERAGLITVGDNNEVKARSARGKPMPWETYTADLLWARAVSRLVRRLAPDCADQTLVPI